MKQYYFAICPLPLACLLISFFVPADKQAVSQHPFEWLTLAVLGSPLVALIGFGLIAATYSEGKSITSFVIATVVAALPILYFLLTDFLPK